MIEVEKNFDLRAGDKEQLIRGAVLLAKKTFTDVYYDTPIYSLTGKDFWLRKRDSRFELKVPLNRSAIGERVSDQYRELETEAEIAAELGFSVNGSFEETLARLGYTPFARFATSRESYRVGDFHLDFDEADFGFSAFEVELMVERAEDIPAAEKKILDFARKHRLSVTPGATYGKLIEYIKRTNPAHYAFLVACGVV